MDRYINGEMIEYIFNRSYFLQLPLYVDKNVLIPRQETEDLALQTCRLINTYYRYGNATIADVCTGSGAIGLYMSANYPHSKIYLSDCSKEAIRVAEKNAENLNLTVETLLDAIDFTPSSITTEDNFSQKLNTVLSIDVTEPGRVIDNNDLHA